MKPYESRFTIGDRVRVVDTQHLNEFRREWKYHTPLTDEQIDHGGETARVADVGFYHGGDPLYQLEGLPGLWHEQCLSDA